MPECLSEAELAAIKWRAMEKRLRERPCDCDNCEWAYRLLVDSGND